MQIAHAVPSHDVVSVRNCQSQFPVCASNAKLPKPTMRLARGPLYFSICASVPTYTRNRKFVRWSRRQPSCLAGCVPIPMSRSCYSFTRPASALAKPSAYNSAIKNVTRKSYAFGPEKSARLGSSRSGPACSPDWTRFSSTESKRARRPTPTLPCFGIRGAGRIAVWASNISRLLRLVCGKRRGYRSRGPRVHDIRHALLAIGCCSGTERGPTCKPSCRCWRPISVTAPFYLPSFT